MISCYNTSCRHSITGTFEPRLCAGCVADGLTIARCACCGGADVAQLGHEEPHICLNCTNAAIRRHAQEAPNEND